MKKLSIVFFLLLISFSQLRAEEMPSNSTYKVEINDGGGWKTLYSHNAKVFWDKYDMSFVKFTNAFTSDVKVKVTKNTGTFDKVEIRPLSYKIEHKTTASNAIEFTMKDPRKISVEFDGDRYNNLFIFADKPETSTPDKNDPNVIWYGRGIHHIGKITLQSNQTLYLHEDALVYGYIEAQDASNIRVCGRGIIDSSKENHDYAYDRNGQLFFINCSNITIQDILMRDTPTWNLTLLGCDQAHISGIKQIGSNANSDGLDIVSCSNLLIENTFQRNKDDNISIKAFDPKLENFLDGMRGHKVDRINVENSFNITMRNCVLWADEAHNMLVGPDIRKRKAHNIHFDNIDVLENTQNDDKYPGVMAVMCADDAEYYNIHWNNIRIEDINQGQPISFTFQNPYTIDFKYGKFLKDVTVSNVTYNGKRASQSRILGLNAEQIIDGVTITNYVINGKKAIDLKSANISTNEFAKNIILK